jgi:hypothetical protein
MPLRHREREQTSVEYRSTIAPSERSTTRPDSVARETPQRDPQLPIQRLLFVADAAVAGADELPPRVRAIIDAAVEVYVVTPTLPGRLAWLADDVDGFRHVADERLNTVLGQMRALRAHVNGDALRGSVMTVITDGVETFRPDHILLALRSSVHANWQEFGLVEHVERRFGLPLTTFAIDPDGHVATAADPPTTLRSYPPC